MISVDACFVFSNNNLNDNSMVVIMAGPGQNMNMNNVGGRAFTPDLGEDVKRQLYSCKKRLGMTDMYILRGFYMISLDCEKELRGSALSKKFVEILKDEIDDHINGYSIEDFPSNCDSPVKNICGSLVTL